MNDARKVAVEAQTHLKMALDTFKVFGAWKAGGIKEKGWDLLINAFRRMDSNARLLLVGEGPCLDELRASFGSDQRITFVGFHPNPVEVIRDADVFEYLDQ